MGAIRLATSASTDEEYGGTFATEATDVAYDNTQSGLTADDVQEAIDEVAQPFIKVVGHSASKTVSGSGAVWFSQSDFNVSAISGYSFIGIIAYHITQTNQCFIRSMQISDATDFIALTNISSNQVNATVNIQCLYVKTNKIA